MNILGTPKRKQLPFLLFGVLALLWLMLSPSLVSAFAGFGDYISEKLLGDGTNEAQYLGDGANELIVAGSGPIVSTLLVTDATAKGEGSATLRGNLADLNGMPQADVWFVWGYGASSLTNTTPATTVFATGEQTAVITGFTNTNVYYQFQVSTDGTSSGATRYFEADAGFALLDTALPIVIALAILVFAFLATGNPILALFGSIIGLLAFYIVKAILEAIS